MSDEPRKPAPVDEAAEVRIEFRARRVLLTVLIVCVLAEIGFVVADYHLNYRKLVDVSAIRHLFNNTREDAIGSWFAITQTALVAVTAWVIFITTRACKRPGFVRWGWLIIAVFFSYMTMDDGAEIHERMGSTFKALQRRASAAAGEDTAGQKLLGIFPSYAWQAVFLPVFGTFGLFMLVFLWREMGSRLSRCLVLAGISCLVVAVGMDFVEGLDEDHAWNLWMKLGEIPAVDAFTEDRFDRDGFTAVRHFGKAVEESLEMFGITLLWLSFLGYWMRTAPQTSLRFT